MATVQMNDQSHMVRGGGLIVCPAQMVMRPHHLLLAKPNTSCIAGPFTYSASLGKSIQYSVEDELRSLFVISNVV